MRRFSLALLLFAGVSAARADAPPTEAKAAIAKGLRRIERGAANYPKNRDCFSCHHQTTSIVVLTEARRRGFAIDPAAVGTQLDFTLAYLQPRIEQMKKGRGLGGHNTMAAHALFALEVAGHPADDVSAALVEFLLQRQSGDGSWPATTKRRPPTEGSAFSNAALAIRGLRAYRPAKEGELRQRVDAALGRGKAWLLEAKPADTEDATGRLRGLAYAGAERREVEAARSALLKGQRADGSWSQVPRRDGDAYATATALLALRAGGLDVADPAYRKGVTYLLRTQRDDGAWLVTTRAEPVQKFFDNGDAGGKSQFVSFVATGWATLAILELFPAK